MALIFGIYIGQELIEMTRKLFPLSDRREDTASNTDKNPAYILKQLKPGQLPKIYMACGTEDSLITANRNFKTHLEEAGAELIYVEAPGVHEWVFWDKQIEKAMEWFRK